MSDERSPAEKPVVSSSISALGHTFESRIEKKNPPGNNKPGAANGVYTLTGVIDDNMVSDFIGYLAELPSNLIAGDTSSLKIFINSPGGGVSAGFGFIDAMRSCSTPVSTIVVGTAASMASLIACSGQHGLRYIGENSRLMTHQFTTGFWGTDREYQANQRKLDQVRKMMIRHYVNNSNLTKQQVLKYLYDNGDNWITAKKAIKYGLVDALIPDRIAGGKKSC